MSLLEEARDDLVSTEIIVAANIENIEPDDLRELVANGRVTILRNRKRPVKIEPVAIGQGMRTKVNANIGTSEDSQSVENELKKLTAAISAGADTVMDLSTGGDLDEIRREIIAASTVPIGTVPIYEAAVNRRNRGEPVVDMDPDELFDVIEKHGEQGVDFVTVHAGVTHKVVQDLLMSSRVMDIVSRGGAFHAEWIHKNMRENPLYEQFDRLCDIARKYEMTISLGDGLRPGAIADATDRPQIAELVVLGELVHRARENGVQAMVEGPGHVPIDDVSANIQIQKQICDEAPFYVLGPIVTDVAPGYDHVTSAIGGAIAAASGADFLCYVTCNEHLSLPDVEAVRQGVIVTKIAAHAGDIAKDIPGAWEWDHKMSEARHELDWDTMLDLAIDPEVATKIREKSPPREEDTCTMCGQYCAVKRISELRKSMKEKK